MGMGADGGAKGFIANYEINYNDLLFDRKISEGGYGIVYRGRWKYTTVAIKEIKERSSSRKNLRNLRMNVLSWRLSDILTLSYSLEHAQSSQICV